LFSHDLDGIPRGEKPGIWKALLNRVYAKEMISVAMRRIDGGQTLSTRCDPFRERPVLFHGNEGIDQHCISFA
jgi:hypothetical protein